MLYKLVAFSLWGGIVALDTTAVMQTLISHPLVSCSVTGLILGNFKIAFLIGVVLELIWLNELPVGAAPFSEGNIGATVAAATAILIYNQTLRMQMAIPLACLLGVAVSYVGGYMVIWARYVNGRIYSRLLDQERITPSSISTTHLASIAAFYFGGVLYTVLATTICYYVLLAVTPLIPTSWDARLWPIMGAFLGVGCAVLLYMFVTRKNWWLLLMGAALGGLFLFV